MKQRPASFSAENPASESSNTDENLILTASIENKIEYSTPLVRSNAARKDIQTKMIISTPCDVIIFENGEEVEAKVLEINENEVKYRKCNNLDGPLLVVSKSKIFAIKHPNGTKTMINEPANQYSSYVSPEDEHGPQDKSQGHCNRALVFFRNTWSSSFLSWTYWNWSTLSAYRKFMWYWLDN